MHPRRALQPAACPRLFARSAVHSLALHLFLHLLPHLFLHLLLHLFLHLLLQLLHLLLQLLLVQLQRLPRVLQPAGVVACAAAVATA